MSITDFTLIKELGAGSYGKVFKAVKKNDQQTYAIKEVKLSGMDRKDRENAVNEVRLLASINISNVIKFKDTFVDDMRGILYLVMEFADGGDLQVDWLLFRDKFRHIRRKALGLASKRFGRSPLSYYLG